MSLRAIPLLAISLILYNLVVLMFSGGDGQAATSADGATVATGPPPRWTQ